MNRHLSLGSRLRLIAWPRWLLVMSLFFAGVLLPTQTTFAAAITVSASGGGNYTTIQTAVNNAAPGDTILIRGGTYSENVDLTLMGSAIGGAKGNLTLYAVDGAGTATLSGSGIKLRNSGSYGGNLVIDGLAFTSTTDDAIQLSDVASLTVVNSTFNPVGDGEDDNAIQLTKSSGTGTVALFNNTFSNIAYDVVTIAASGSTQLNITAANNTFTDDSTSTNVPDQGIVIATSATAGASVSIIDNTFTKLENFAVYLQALGTSQISGVVANNTINNLQASDTAIHVDQENSTVALSITNNQITNIALGGGIGVSVTGTSQGSYAITNNTITTIGDEGYDNGIWVDGSDTAAGTTKLLLDNNTISNVQGSGISLRSLGAMSLEATVTNNRFTSTDLAGEVRGALRVVAGSSGDSANLTLRTAGNSFNANNVYLRNATSNTGFFRVVGTEATPSDHILGNNLTVGSITTLGTLSMTSVGITAPTQNTAPSATDDTVSGVNIDSIAIDALNNDLAVDGDAKNLTFFTLVSSRGGAVSRNTNGTPADLSDDRISYTALSGFTGTDTLYYIVSDSKGGSDIGKVTLTITADTTPPDTTITSNPSLLSSSRAASFSFTGSDNLTPVASLTFQCKLDSGVFTACSSPQSYTGLADGNHTFQVRAVDASGNVDSTPATYSWNIDATAPAAPVVSTPANGSSTSNTTPTFSGTAEALSTVSVIVDGSSLGTVSADASGNWSFTPTTALSEGNHSVKATAADALGNTSPESSANSFTVDTTAPAAPTVNTPANGSNTNDNTPTFSGTAEALSMVSVIVDGSALGTVSADASGNWSYTPTTALTDGSHTVKASATDAASNTSPESSTNSFTVDTSAPAAPTVSTPANGSSTNDSTPTFSGTAETLSTVSVIIDGSALGTVNADASGNWSYTPTTALTDGSHTVKATATDAANNTSADSNTNSFTVDTTAPAAPMVSTPANGSSTNDNTPIFSGTAEALSTVSVIVDGSSLGTVSADASGNWSFTPTTALSEGNHSVKATATDALGNTSPESSANSFTVDTTAPAAPTVSTPANGSNTNDNTPTFSGTAETLSMVSVIVDGSALGAVSADASGNWSFTPTTALTDGSHTVKATTTDAANNTSSDSATNSFTVDTTAPAAPVVSTPANGSSTNDNTPTFSGTAEALSTVSVIIDGSSLGTVSADASGNWSYTPTTALTDGSHTVKATATDAANNTSVDSTTNSFTIDTTAPATTITSTPASVSQLATASFSFSATDGSGTGVASYECSLDSGTFVACSSPQSYVGLSEGSHLFAVRAIDAVGNQETPPVQFSWQVDLSAPETTITSGPTAFTNLDSASITFSGTDGSGSGVTSYECSLDSAAFAACSSPVPLTGLTDGVHTFEVRAIDAAGNLDPTPATISWTIDTTPLTVTIDQATTQSDPSTSAPLSFTVVFNKPVSDFTGSAIDLSASTAPGLLSATVTASGPLDGTTYTVAVSGMTGSGDIIASIPANVATDIAGNSNTASSSSDNSITFDPDLPLVTGIMLADPSPTKADSVHFNITFSEAVTGVDLGDFALSSSGPSGASLTSISGSGTTWVVSVATGTGSGTIRLDLVDNDTISSVLSGIALGGSGAANGSFTGDSYTVDRIAPTASLPTPPIANSGASDLTFTVLYSDNIAIDISSLDNADLRITGPNGFEQLASLVSVTPAGNGSPRSATYRLAAPGGSWDGRDNGIYQIAVQSGQVKDAAGNLLAAQTLGSFTVNLTSLTYLPLVALPQSPPDLVVDSITVDSSGITVVIRNQGGQSVTDPFWIDLYLNPTTAPTAVNQTWPMLSSYGAVWGVSEQGLPLAPGQSLTLSLDSSFFLAGYSSLPSQITAGSKIYVQVDSADANTSYGAVLESHEIDGGEYNNITGITVPASVTLSQQITTAGIATPNGLPTRPDETTYGRR